MINLEEMSAFFAARVDGYDEHMLQNVAGCRAGYKAMAEHVPSGTRTLLDLGCGTGLELDEIFKLHPGVEVTGIDMTREMLDVLKAKYKNKNITLLCGDYFEVAFGRERYNCAVSFQTMHHFTHDRKRELYARVRDALCDGGVYIECDYMAKTQEEEELHFSALDKMRRELSLEGGTFYHYDTPCTVENQIKLLYSAGFSSVDQVFSEASTVMLVAKKT